MIRVSASTVALRHHVRESDVLKFADSLDRRYSVVVAVGWQSPEDLDDPPAVIGARSAAHAEKLTETWHRRLIIEYQILHLDADRRIARAVAYWVEPQPPVGD